MRILSPKQASNALPDLQFHPVSLSDRERYLSLLSYTDRDADHAFVNLFIWNESYHQEIAFCEIDGLPFAAIRFLDAEGCCRYLFPVGNAPLAPTVSALRRANAVGCTNALTLVGVTEQQARALQSAFPDQFECTETRDIADYLYDATSLATLSGKKLHAKRNHINAFTAAHSWQVIPLAPEHFPACREILTAWGDEHKDQSATHERRAIERALDAFDALELHGALLIADGIPTAFTLGSMLTPDTLCVHVEKALPDVGGYPVINREFVRMMREKYPALALVNREDDMGLENLRKAKLSYRPTILLQKHTLLDISPKTTNEVLL